ncbi:hypothetical protein [Deinococcus ficus]|nr:hypothetical protein [Deinococcus ficus]
MTPLPNPAALQHLIQNLSGQRTNAHYTLSGDTLHGELRFEHGTLGQVTALTSAGPLTGGAALQYLLDDNSRYPLTLQQLEPGARKVPDMPDDLDLELQFDPAMAELMARGEGPESTVIIPAAFWTTTQQVLNRAVGPAAMSLVRRSAKKHGLAVGENLTMGQARTLHRELADTVSATKRGALETQFTQLLSQYR